MGRPIDQESDRYQICEKIKETRDNVLLPKKKAPRPIHIHLRAPEVIDGEHNPGHCSLEFPSAPVITEFANRPQQQEWSHDMEQDEQTDRQAQLWHHTVFREEVDMMFGQKRA